MPYQGSAQSIGFRNRTVIDPSKRKREEAQQLKERGREQVRGMETQASQQIKEMQRVGDLQAKNAEYELKALSKFSKTIESFVTDTVVPFVEERQEEERFNQELSYYLQDAETLKAAEEEVDASIAEGQRIHIALNAEANKVDDPEIEDRIRAASNQHTRGWQLANLREKANGWGTYLIGELDTSEVRLEDERTGQAFAIKDAKDAYQKELAIRYLQANYIKENRGNLSAKVVVTKLVQPMSKATAKQRNTYKEKFRTDAARQALDAEQNNFFTALSNPDASLETQTQALTSYFTVAPGLYKTINPNAEQFSASRIGLRNMIDTLIKTSPYEVGRIIDVLKMTNMPNHPAGPGTLFDHYKDEFNEQEIRALATQASNADYQQKTTARTIEAKAEYDQIIKNWNENNPTPDEIALVTQKFSENYFYNQDLINNLRTWSPSFLGVEASEAKATAILAASGEITESQAENLDYTVRQKYQNRIVKQAFGAADKQAFQDAQKIVTAAIKEVRNITLNDSVLYDDALRAQSKAFSMIIPDARALFQAAKEDGKPITEGQAILAAAGKLADRIESEQGLENKNDLFYSSTNEGFKNFEKEPSTGLEAVFERRKLDYRKANNLLRKDPDALINNKVISDPTQLELNSRGTPKSTFYQLARLDGKRNAWEILNAQRSFYPGLAAVPIPKEADILQSYLKRNPSARSLFYNQPSYQRINRGLQSIGTVSAPNLLKAIGFQESGGGNYQAYNADSYGPSNPALGKYQILWTTALDWSRRAGMDPPVSKQAFLNDPEKQESLARWAMNEYVRQAMVKSNNNPRIAIRMAAAMWYGGADAINSYDRPTKETGGRYPSMREYTTSVLNHYLAS